MLDKASSATFQPHVGERFQLTPQEGEPLEAVLSSCEETPFGSPEEWAERVERVPFSLMFHVESAHTAEQQIFSLRHPELGEFELFLVPLGADEQGMRYQAVIS